MTLIHLSNLTRWIYVVRPKCEANYVERKYQNDIDDKSMSNDIYIYIYIYKYINIYMIKTNMNKIMRSTKCNENHDRLVSMITSDINVNGNNFKHFPIT